jgi:hypothetical protein
MLSCCLTELLGHPVFHGFLFLDSDSLKAWSVDIEHAAINGHCGIRPLVTMQASGIDPRLASALKLFDYHDWALRGALRTSDPRLQQKTSEGGCHRGINQPRIVALFNPFARCVKRLDMVLESMQAL